MINFFYIFIFFPIFGREKLRNDMYSPRKTLYSAKAAFNSLQSDYCILSLYLSGLLMPSDTFLCLPWWCQHLLHRGAVCQDKICGILTALLCSKEVHSIVWVLPTMHCFSSSCGVKWMNLLLWGKLLKQTAGIAEVPFPHFRLPPAFATQKSALAASHSTPHTSESIQLSAPAKMYVLLFAKVHFSTQKLSICKLS